MFTSIARREYLKGLHALERGDLDALLSQFADPCAFTFVGDTPLGAELSTKSDIRRWFERFGRLLPERTFHVQRLVVSGPPWKLRLAAHVVIRSQVDGEPYHNQFAHFLLLQWGKVVEDLIIEDTQRWADACTRLAVGGVDEATALPLQPA